MWRSYPPNRDPKDHSQPQSENNERQSPRIIHHKVTKNTKPNREWIRYACFGVIRQPPDESTRR
jgi:hypothetical protein